VKNFNGRSFFSLFFVARINQKIRNLALGRESIFGAAHTLEKQKNQVYNFLDSQKRVLYLGGQLQRMKHQDTKSVFTPDLFLKF
jgi:hypothetical protein